MADRDVRVRLSASVAQYIAGMQAAAEATDRVTASGANLNKLGGTFQSVGRTLTMGVTAPIAAAGAAAVTMSNRFNTSFTRMTTLAGMSTSEIGGMRDAVLSLSKQTGRGPQELADALYNASSSGLDARQSIDAVTIAAKGAASGLGSSGDIISLVASATNSYGAEVLDAAKATDILVGTIREGRADPDELAGSLGRILPTASALGVSFEEVGGSVAFLSNIMGDTNMTITSLGDLMSKLQSPTQQGREALAQYGTSMQELHRIISEDGLLGAMQHLRDIGLSDDPLAFRAVFEDEQARRGARAMIDNLGDLESAIDGVKNSSGALEEAWTAAQGEEGFKMAQAWAEIQVALVEFGDAIGPVAADIAGGVAHIASAFGSLPDGVQMAIAGVLIAVGPLAMVAGTIMKHAQTIAAARALMLAPGPNIAGAAGVLPWWARGAGVAAAGVGVGVGLDALLGYVYSPNNWTGGRDTTPDRPAPPRQVGNWATDAQMAQAGAWGITTGDWMFGGGGTPFFSTGALTTPRPAPPPGPPSINPPRGWDDTYRRAGPPTFGPPPSFDMGLADAFAESAANLERLTALAREYSLVTSSTDWGAAAFTAAKTAMGEFTSESFGLVNIAMASEEAFARLGGAVEKNGFTLDIATEAGRENMVALQGVASVLDTQFVSAYDAANGSLDAFMASATTIGNETLKRLQTELGLTDEQTKQLADTLNLTAKDHEARFKLSGTEEARVKLGLLTGVIGLLQEDVQREVAMRIATGDFQGALDLVQANIAETPEEKNVTVSVNDKASGPIGAIRSKLDGLKSKTITVTTENITVYGTKNLGTLKKNALGGYFDSPEIGMYGEAGAEVILPLTRPDRMRQLLSDPRVMTPLTAAMGSMSAGSSGSSSAAGASGASVTSTLVVQGSIYGVEHLNRVLDQRDRQLKTELRVAR